MFVGLTELALTYALTKSTGGIQIAVMVFVFVFPTLTLAGFLAILWCRAWVFYPPSEYSTVRPKEYADAFRISGPLVARQVELAQAVVSSPTDQEAMFELMDGLLDVVCCQAVILMHEKSIELSEMSPFVYELSDGQGGTGGGLGKRDSLVSAGLGILTQGGKLLSLTDRGHEFAKWLLRRNRKAQFFWLPQGSWGTPTSDFFKQAMQRMKERLSKPGIPSRITNTCPAD